MKMLALLLLNLAVALALPPFPLGVAQSPDLIKEEESPLLGDWVPVQGHVEVEHPGPQVRQESKEQQEKMAPKPVDMLEQELKAKPEVKEEQEGMVELEVKVKPDVKAEEEVKEVKVEQELKAEPEVKTEVKVAPAVNLNLEVMEDLPVNIKPEAEMEPELSADPDLKVEPEVKVKQDVQEDIEPKEKPMFNQDKQVQEEFPTLMNLEAENEIGQDVQERHIDMERLNEMVDEPIMKLEPLENKMFSESFQSQDSAVEPLPEGKGLMKKGGNALDEEPVVELEPEMKEEPFLNQEVMPEAAVMEDGAALDFLGDPIQPLEDYFPNEEARMEVELSMQQDSLTVDGTDRFRMVKRSEESPMADMPQFEELPVEDSPVLNGDAQILERPFLPKQDKLGQGYCPGEVLEGKCYEFFKGPKRAADAEFFCQDHFPGGHLASITSQYIHRKLMAMMLRKNGAYTRTWIGGLRYLKTDRFIWLDGSKWDYADWLSGEPNNTSNLEDCVEVLAFGNVNDFTCWEPQAFICSYHFQ